MRDFLNFFIKLSISVILGAMIGFEREKRNRPAGLRTHILVSLGSCLFTVTSIEISKFYSGVDPSRIAANIVTGIGFLGAGAILREGLTIKGLTTAATIWVSSAIGLSTGLGLFIPSFMTSITTLLILILLKNLEFGISGRAKNIRIFNIKVTDKPGQLGRIGTIFGEFGIHIKNVKFERDEKFLSIEFIVGMPENINIQDVCDRLSKENFIIEFTTE